MIIPATGLITWNAFLSGECACANRCSIRGGRAGAVEVEVQTRATVSRYRSHNRISEEIDPGFVRLRPARLLQLPFHCSQIGLKFGFNLPEPHFCTPGFVRARGAAARNPALATRSKKI